MLKLKKMFINRAIKNSFFDAKRLIRREVQLVKKGTHELGKSLLPKRIPIKIKGK